VKGKCLILLSITPLLRQKYGECSTESLAQKSYAGLHIPYAD
jgi:hypothetical protein